MENSHKSAKRSHLPNIVIVRRARQREPSRPRVEPPILRKNYMLLQQRAEQRNSCVINHALDIIPTWAPAIPPEYGDCDLYMEIKKDIDRQMRPYKEELSQNIPFRVLPHVEVSEEMLDMSRDYDVEVYKHPYVIIQHDSSAKETLTSVFRDAGHTIIHTDLNFTGMLWDGDTYNDLLDYIDATSIQYIILPFTMKRWAGGIDEEFLQDDGIYTSLINYDEWCSGVIDKLWNKELFHELNMWNLSVGVRVDCSAAGDAPEQATRLKNDICWVLQFQAIQRKLHWRVNYYTSDAECDITLIVTISDRCIIAGIQVRRPQKALPENQTSIGHSLMWPFLQCAKLFTCVDVRCKNNVIRMCILWHNDNLAAFYQEFKSSNRTRDPIECWKPVNLEMDRIIALWDRQHPTRHNRDIQCTLNDLKCLLQRSQIIQKRRSTDATITSQWIV